ncbi:MAG TPA: BREX system Lon protease-like protein BrxL [Gemmataceae bacterium]|nr:BREX system Lon protease-like protein BrxL [Gemmataceae bacterium]
MSLYDEVPLSDLDRKARQVFGEQVVPKSLAQQAVFHGLPRYVSEYLIAKYVRPETWQDDLAKVQAKIKDLLPDIERRELVKDRLLRMGETVLIDYVEARVDLKNGQRWARVPAINDEKVRVSAVLLEQHSGLLLGGLWGTAKLRYAPEVAADAPNELTAFTPFQVGPPDLATYRAGRSQFTTDEWLGLMLQSAGYAPPAFPNRRQQLLLLARLVPLVERNVNLVELGPRQTGKTFLLRNVSPRTFTISGGKTTPANLFVNLATRAVGILGTRKVVVFDEIAHTTFGDEDATISTLKDYMESGQFSRGAKSFAADASLVFTGNLDVDGEQPDPRYRHLFEPLPKELIDSAFLDRVQGYLPGWEVPKITPAALANGVGFVTDYFGEVLVKLREDDFQDRIQALESAAGMTRRDQVAVQRTASGLIKLVYPDGKVSDEELHEVVALACELRQRVHNQLTEIAPGEFKPRLIGCGGVTEHTAVDLRLVREVLPQDDRLNREAVIGAVTGLSVIMQDGTIRDSSISLIQVSAFSKDHRGKGSLEVTGSHGRVLTDSVRTAYNIVRTRFREFAINEKRLQDQQVAVHLVRIAEPKEGPSAGLAFVVGIVSALTGRPIKPAVAMTGEVTLHGEVIGVGGVPWKIRAAAKAGRKLVLIPAENAKEVAQVPNDVLAKVEVVPVKTIQEALERVLLEALTVEAEDRARLESTA